MINEIEDSISKNLTLYLSFHGCRSCLKPYSSNTLIEIDDLAFIFAEKFFYKFNCSISNNITTIKKDIKFIVKNKTRVTFSLLKPSLHGNVVRFGITCMNCFETRFLEYNLSKFDGTKNYI